MIDVLNMKNYIIVCAMELMAFNVFAESNYSYDLKKDIILGSLSLGVFIPSLFITSSPEEPGTLQKENINSLI